MAIVTGDMVLLGLFLFFFFFLILFYFIRAFSNSSAPVRIEHEGGAAARVAGILAAPRVQGHRLPQLWPYQRLFLTSDSWILEGLFD